MQVASKQLAFALFKSLEEGANPKRLSVQFANYLAIHHLEALMPRILRELVREAKAREHARAAVIVTSHQISKKTQKAIEVFIGKLSEDVSEHVVDPTLVGGFRATYRGRVFDGSIRNYLKELRQVLAQ